MKGDGVTDPAGQESSDVVPPIFFSDSTLDTVSRGNLAYLPPPHREGWITPTRCVAMDCDGPKKVLIHDLDGTFTGLGADSSILARAEFMHQTRDDVSEWTWYNIPTKMLYDPAPLNDLGWHTHDMSDYMNYSNGVQSFGYRRRASAEFLEGWSGAPRHVPGATPTFTLDEILHHRRLSSAVLSDWKERMVFYTGDERNFYQGASSLACDPSEAAFDPSCRSPRKTHREVAYAGTGGYPDGYGVYRDGCTFMAAWNAWSCTNSSLTPARLVIESMDADHKSRSLVPVALATGGYVDLMNAGWDHQRALDCGGYNCLQRLMTFHTTIALRRGYDLACICRQIKPQTLRLAPTLLLTPSGPVSGQSRAPTRKTCG